MRKVEFAASRFLLPLAGVIKACVATGAELMERCGYQASLAVFDYDVFEPSVQVGMRSIAVFRIVVGNSP